MIRGTAAAAGAWLTSSRWAPLVAGERHFKLGACDWSLGKMCEPSALDVAKEVGLDGVQVSLGTEANGMHLKDPAVRKQYEEASRRTGEAIASLAIGELNGIPYKSDPRTVAWVGQSIDACQALGCQVVLLAFFGNGDLKGDAAGTDEVVRRLKEVAPKAEKQKVILGIESWLSAEESVAIIERVGSPAVRMYYDVANSEKMGYDIYKEIRWLGTKYICEIHLKENDALLGQGRVDFKKVREALDAIGYSGWMQIEGAVPKGGKLIESYQANCRYLRALFPRTV
jgi:sugar phosphate isomerase/epimerase